MTLQMKADDQQIVDMLPDYLNGHLPPSDAERVEAALESSEAVRKQMRFERQLQQSLRSESEVSVEGLSADGFESIRSRLDTGSKPFWSWSLPYVGAMAPLALLAVVVLQFETSPSSPFDVEAIENNQRFETRFDEPVSYTQPTLRILFEEPMESAEIEDWLREQKLELTDVTGGPRRMLEVTADRDASELALLLKQLRSDDRIQAIKVMGTDE
ncbi:MAG: zf-HC2 domain-containing protein [Pseudomonadota bacterium]